MCRSVVVSYAHQNQLSECWECRPSRRGRRTSQCFKSHFFSPLFLSLSPHHFLLTLSHPLSFLICLPPSPSLPLLFPLVFSDHHRHQSDASLHLQPGPRASGPGREAGRLLPGEGGVRGGETRRTQKQGQESPYLTALPHQIHRRRHGWVTRSRHLHASFKSYLTSVQRLKVYEPSTASMGPHILRP